MSPVLAPTLAEPVPFDVTAFGNEAAALPFVQPALAVPGSRSAPVARSGPISRAVWIERTTDYVQLTKPKIALLELATVAVAAWLASAASLPLASLAHALLGTALVAASASAINQWLERDLDRRMRRTATRPLPAGRLSPGEALWFGCATGAAGLAWLAMFVNGLTAALGLATWALYVCLYTPLKRRTSFNTFVGAVAGALPIAIGWTAVDGSWGLTAWSLFLTLFLWQFPHFMAIAWIYRRQYASAGLQMLPVVDPSGRRAGRQAMACAALLLPVSLLAVYAGAAGAGFAAWATCLGLGQFVCAWRFARRLDDGSARTLLRASLVYLPALLLGLLLAAGASLSAATT